MPQSPAVVRLVRRAAASLCLLAAAALAADGDWPQWRGDAGHTAAVAGTLPDALHPQWTLKLPPQKTAWTDEGDLLFDRSYQPIIAGQRLLLASTVNDSVMAYDVATGALAWRFTAEGPIRCPPAVWQDLVFVGSDDGVLYALGLADGKVRWSFRGAPADRRCVGNERVVSTWPIRGGPVVADDRVYFAAGLWPFMGSFVHALDARTGRPVWINDALSFVFRPLPHPNSEGFAGLAPQGTLAVAGDKLIVPNSRSNAAILDRRTGKLVGFAEFGTPDVVATDRFAFTGGQIFEVNTGYAVRFRTALRLGRPVLARDVWYTPEGAWDLRQLALTQSTETPKYAPDHDEGDGEPEKYQVFTGSPQRLWAGKGTPWALAGSRLVVTDKGCVATLDVSTPAAEPKPLWRSAKLEGQVSSVAVGAGRLFVVLADGTVTCFGAEKVEPRTIVATPSELQPNAAWSARAKDLLKAAGQPEGYALVLGLNDGGLVEELVRQSKLHVITVDADPAKVESLRRRLDAAGLYGPRAAAWVGEVGAIPFAPYLFSLITSERPEVALDTPAEKVGERLFEPLRPYGGAIVLPLSAAQHTDFANRVNAAKLVGGELARTGDWTVLRRPGPLPGSAPWLGQNADAGNSRCSRDERVQAPLGVLWWGNALSNSLILPRHGEGPVEQVAGGRLFIEGPDSLNAMDVYTGRLLWSRTFPGLGRLYNSTKHQRGAHSVGSNFFVVPDAVYVSVGESCHLLDPATGETRAEFKLPPRAGETEPNLWHFLLVVDDLLIAGSRPILDPKQSPTRVYSPTSSKGLVVMDRRTGKVLWTREAEQGFRHYGIVAGNGKLFVIDRTPEEAIKALQAASQPVVEKTRLLALDPRTGKVLWERTELVGPALCYVPEQDILLAGAALRGADGSVVWDRPEVMGAAWWGKWGPLIRGTQIITQGTRAFDLLTGQQKMRLNAYGQEEPWGFGRAHGCGPIAGGLNLLTFRSGNAAFYDLKSYGGTGNWGGFRSGCTSNLIAADGVLNAPDYTRTCTCGYQIRSSLALVHMPDVEYWTFGAARTAGRVGYNFGAPGDRVADDGTLWRATPNLVGRRAGPPVLAPTTPEKPERFCHHVLRMRDGQGWKWVGASGLVGVRSVRIPLENVDASKPLRVRLFFSEPESLQPGQRVFNVAAGGKTVLANLDVVKEAGAPMTTIVKEVTGVPLVAAVPAASQPAMLELTFTPTAGEPLICGVEVVEADRVSAR